MQFRTEIDIPFVPSRLSRTKGILTVGSCFAETMGRKLEAVKANALVNPFGTIFNPLSAHKLIRAAAELDFSFLKDGLVQHQGTWVHYDFHSSFHHTHPEGLLEMLEHNLRATHDYLQGAQALLLTWGTAFGYERKDTGTMVANCHKIPQKQFTKRLLPLETITTDARQTLALLQNRFPALQVILTVSPVRHLKDTLPLNSVSKSVLRLAAHLSLEGNSSASYFPAYELLLDDLRDYRFYGADLLHPSQMAEEYIWGKFIGAYADPAFASFLERWAALQRDLRHRPFHPGSAEHRNFLQQLLARLEEITLEADVHQEMTFVRNQLSPT